MTTQLYSCIDELMLALDLALERRDKHMLMLNTGHYLGRAKGWAVFTGDGKMHEISEDFKLRDEIHYVSSVTHDMTAKLLVCAKSSELCIEVPENIVHIDEYAFSSCTNVIKVSLPSTLRTIGKRAFADSSITEICLPDNVIGIGDSAFISCTALEHAKLSSKLEQVSYGAFTDSGLKEIDIPSSVQCIQQNAFRKCRYLKSVTGCKSLEYIDSCAFKACIFLESIPSLDAAKCIENYAFCECLSLKTVEVGESIERIGSAAFRECDSLSSLVFKGKTLEQVKKMEHYPWGIKDENVIHGEL